MTIEKFKKNVDIYRPEITVTLGLMTMAAAVVNGIKSAPKAALVKAKTADEKKSKQVFELAKVYAPTAGLYLLGSMFIMNSYSTLTKRAAAIGLAYSMSESAFKEYAGKVTEMVGEKKVDEIKNAIAKDKVDAKPYSEDKVIAGNGPTIVLDAPSGRYFKSDMQTIRAAENSVNKRMLNERSCCWNDFYNEMDWPEISVGDIMGWHVSFDGLNIHYDSVLTGDGTPILVIDYELMPMSDYEGY